MQAKRRGSIVATYDAVARKELDESRRVVRGLERAISTMTSSSLSTSRS